MHGLNNFDGLIDGDRFINELMHAIAKRIVVQFRQSEHFPRLSNSARHASGMADLESLLCTLDCQTQCISASHADRNNGDTEIGRAVVRRVQDNVLADVFITDTGQSIGQLDSTKNYCTTLDSAQGVPLPGTMQQLIGKHERLLILKDAVAVPNDTDRIQAAIERIRSLHFVSHKRSPATKIDGF